MVASMNHKARWIRILTLIVGLGGIHLLSDVFAKNFNSGAGTGMWGLTDVYEKLMLDLNLLFLVSTACFAVSLFILVMSLVANGARAKIFGLVALFGAASAILGAGIALFRAVQYIQATGGESPLVFGAGGFAVATAFIAVGLSTGLVFVVGKVGSAPR